MRSSFYVLKVNQKKGYKPIRNGLQLWYTLGFLLFPTFKCIRISSPSNLP